MTRFPDFKTSSVYVGGRNQGQLLEDLRGIGVELNESARVLFASDKFTTSKTRRRVLVVELSVRDLGFTQGGTTAKLHGAAVALGLFIPPIELGPHLRLQHLDQPEGFWEHPLTHHRAPPGSITIASVPLSDDEGFPKGFYLRRIKGTLWLRGYRAGSEHVWDAHDRFIFCKS